MICPADGGSAALIRGLLRGGTAPPRPRLSPAPMLLGIFFIRWLSPALKRLAFLCHAPLFHPLFPSVSRFDYEFREVFDCNIFGAAFSSDSEIPRRSPSESEWQVSRSVNSIVRHTRYWERKMHFFRTDFHRSCHFNCHLNYLRKYLS